MYKMIFYIFLALLAIIYLFLSANCGYPFDVDRKAYYLDKIPDSIPFIIINRDNMDKIYTLNYPIIFKPNECTGSGVGVEKIDSPEEAKAYIQKIGGGNVIAQEYDQSQCEFAVLYERHPFASKGYVIAIIEKIPINMTGFEPQSVGFIDNGIVKRKCNIVDHTNLITDKFSNYVDEMTKTIPDFYVGRYDIKANSLDDLLNCNFRVIELNGLLGADLRSYVNTVKDFDIGNNLGLQIRWFCKRICIGLEANIKHGPIKVISNLHKDRITKCPSYLDKSVALFNASFK